MSFLGRAFDGAMHALNMNPSTLCGAVDIIVVRQPDGSLKSTPFHLRFGKSQVMNPKNRTVRVYVNYCRTPSSLVMRLDADGNASFVCEALLRPNSPSPSKRTGLVPLKVSIRKRNAEQPRDSDDPMKTVPVAMVETPATPDLRSSGEFGADSGIRFSLCRGNVGALCAENAAQYAEVFRKCEITREAFLADPSIVFNPECIACVDGNFVPGPVGLAHCVARAAYGTELDDMGLGNMPLALAPEAQQEKKKRRKSWGWPFKKGAAQTDGPVVVVENSSQAAEEQRAAAVPQVIRDQFCNEATSEQLESLGLQDGFNHIDFIVEDNGRELALVPCNVFLFNYDQKLVISDIDGTITKSDLGGHISNACGKDWTQPNVARLFRAIHANGYQVLYLSSRSLGMAASTRRYLFGVKQEDDDARVTKLPLGPVFLSPARLFGALNSEVVKREPHKFKMACLSNVVSVFPEGVNPFVAGFGNRNTDTMSYMHVGIEESRVFIVNPAGEVKAGGSGGPPLSYGGMLVMVNEMFPPTVNVRDESLCEMVERLRLSQDILPEDMEALANYDAEAEEDKKDA